MMTNREAREEELEVLQGQARYKYLGIWDDSPFTSVLDDPEETDTDKDSDTEEAE
jgi:hypothetical protein